MITFGNKSKACLEELEAAAQKVLKRAAELTPPEYDWSITEAHRPISRQKELFLDGKSHIDGINKKGSHNYYPAKGWDIYPYLAGFGSLIPRNSCYKELLKFTGKEITETNMHLAEKFVISKMSAVAGFMFAAASDLGVNILWGTDWDKDGNMLDHTFQDYPHFQLVY